jgi:hypothetical protein
LLCAHRSYTTCHIRSKPHVRRLAAALRLEPVGQFKGVQLVGGQHIDGLQGGNPLIQIAEYVVAGFSQPQNVEAVKIRSIGWINDMYAGNDIKAPSDQPFQIPTTAGTATAYSLPAPATPLSPIDEFVKALELFGTSVFLNI